MRGGGHFRDEDLGGRGVVGRWLGCFRERARGDGHDPGDFGRMDHLRREQDRRERFQRQHRAVRRGALRRLLSRRSNRRIWRRHPSGKGGR